MSYHPMCKECIDQPVCGNIFLLLFIALSLTSVHYHDIRKAILSGPHIEYKTVSFLSPQKGLKEFQKEQKYFWKGRVASCYLSSWFCNAFGSNIHKLEQAHSKLIKDKNRKNYIEYSKQLNTFANAVSAYGSVLLFLTFLMIIFISKKPFIFIIGLSAALQYAWLPMSEGQFNPWDPLTLLSWTAVLLLNITKHKRAILYLIPLSAIFKEIIVVCAILILFWEDYPLKERIRVFLIISIISVLVKMGLTLLGGCESVLGNQSFHFENICRTGEYWIIHRNWNSIWWWSNFNHVLFATAGLWLAIFIFPGIHIKYRIIAAVYLGTVMIPGNITEARLFQELIPVFFVGYESIKKKIHYPVTE